MVSVESDDLWGVPADRQHLGAKDKSPSLGEASLFVQAGVAALYRGPAALLPSDRQRDDAQRPLSSKLRPEGQRVACEEIDSVLVRRIPTPWVEEYHRTATGIRI